MCLPVHLQPIFTFEPQATGYLLCVFKILTVWCVNRQVAAAAAVKSQAQLCDITDQQRGTKPSVPWGPRHVAEFPQCLKLVHLKRHVHLLSDGSRSQPHCRWILMVAWDISQDVLKQSAPGTAQDPTWPTVCTEILFKASYWLPGVMRFSQEMVLRRIWWSLGTKSFAPEKLPHHHVPAFLVLHYVILHKKWCWTGEKFPLRGHSALDFRLWLPMKKK